MEICLKCITLGFLFFQVPLIFAYYPEYVIEQYCQKGNENILYNISKLGASGRIIPATRLPYQPSKNCTIAILTPPELGIVLSIRKIDFRQPGSFCLDYIKIYHSDSRFSPTTHCRFKFDLHEKVSYYAKEILQFIYHVESEISDGLGVEEGFDLTFTVVTEDRKRCQKNNFFLCDNGRCVPYGLTCDSRNNCGDNSDEASVLCDPVLPYRIWKYDGMLFYGLLTCVFLFIIGFSWRYLALRRRRNGEVEELPATLSPYHAVHPSGHFYSRNPAGVQKECLHGSKMESEEGFSNPCYRTEAPPPPYHE